MNGLGVVSRKFRVIERMVYREVPLRPKIERIVKVEWAPRRSEHAGLAVNLRVSMR